MCGFPGRRDSEVCPAFLLCQHMRNPSADKTLRLVLTETSEVVPARCSPGRHLGRDSFGQNERTDVIPPVRSPGSTPSPIPKQGCGYVSESLSRVAALIQ